MINVFEHDATPTWSGFIYQGRIAVYLAIKTMIELRNEGKILEIDKYTIEMEKCEDIAIVYKDENGNRKYSSIHQVKNENKHTLSEYKKPLIQLMLEKGYYKECNAGAPDAYLHIANSIRGENKDFETECLKWKKEILKYYDAVDKACKNYTNNRKFYEELLNELKKEPIGIDRSEYKTQHSTVIKYCKEVVEENHTIDRIKFEEALKKLKDYLLNKLLVPYISSEVSIYKYDNGLNHFDGTKIFDGIVKLVKEYKGNIAGWSENQYKYLADKILNYIDKTILERHKNLQEKKCVVREISLSKLQEIMDTFVENNEKEANILALKRGYLESLDKFCQKCQRNNDYTCHDIDCKLQQAEYRKEKLNEEDFVRFCYNLRPECEKKIEDRACIADLGSKDGLMESVFPIIKEIPSERFIDKEDSSVIYIVSDLILRMDKNWLLDEEISQYNAQGIVLIDELETHLHIELQKKILPFLTEFFPNIQFIVTTHSPYILNSISNAKAYDLEKHVELENLAAFSSDELAEGYFEADEYSDTLKEELERYAQLCSGKELTEEERAERAELKIKFKNLSTDLSGAAREKFEDIERRRETND